MPVPLDRLNTIPAAEFVALLGPVFEHAPWVAETVASQRPFPAVTALHDAMMAAVHAAPVERRLAFVRAHPELGSKVARADITAESRAEQGSLGLDRLSDADFTRFQHLNAAYKARFDIPFIVCVRRQTRAAILALFEQRLMNAPDAELATALDEIGHITRLRLADLVEGPGMPRIHGRLSSHVLNTVNGRPAAGVRIALYEIDDAGLGLIAEAVTNADGRTDAPLLSGAPLRRGRYELRFHVGDYFRRAGQDAGWLDVVPISFGIAEPEGHYHVPLLVTPWSYTTYRGS
ncbi:MAG: 2-oxo-4-hydroxy-4-carboxy-5-ureidoimidazoline decarboxylase [Rhizobiales bacterium]|nr:2-oxo-4-hydroxy-4-carboxy-5-ureidoimidazoline decarboxylase [Hyphomicrobiales bacterium]OJY46929.1 MAG: OHCU decarboxylase [Rhizobiales bacterium 64-17]